MATIKNILEEIQYGKEYVKEQKIKKTIQSSLNEDFGVWSVSTFVKQNLSECDSSKSYYKNFQKASKIYEDFEKKLEEESEISFIYGKMKAQTISNLINESINLLKSKIELKEVNKSAVGNIIAALSYGVNKISEVSHCGHQTITEANDSLGLYIQKASKLITESIS